MKQITSISVENHPLFRCFLAINDPLVRLKKGHYLLALKKNHKKSYPIVITLLQKDKIANTGILLQRTRTALNARYLQKGVGL